MTQQQKLLWEKLTKEAAESGMDNFQARELYDKICNMSKEEKTLLAISVTNDGLEVRMTEEVYGNLALVGLLERIKMTILEKEEAEPAVVKSSQSYDA